MRNSRFSREFEPPVALFFFGIEVTQFRTMTPVMKREKHESVASPPTVLSYAMVTCPM